MGTVLLREIMEKRFHEIINNFKCASAKQGLTFNYDILIDTYIKCNETLKNKVMTETQVVQYLWTAYVNNIYKEYNKNSKIIKVDLEEAEDVIDEPYDNRRTIVYETIMKYLETNFKPNEVKAWYLHFAESKSYDDLIKLGYDNMNFHNIFRNINNHIQIQIPKENKQFKCIVKEIFGKQTK